MTSAYASYDTSYTNRVPYITSAEYINAPTAIDVNNLLGGGSSDANAIALQETIARASSWVDQYTMGSYGTLAATYNTENARIWGNNNGQLVVHPRYWPILEVDTFSYGTQVGFGSGTTSSVTPAGNIWIEPQQFVVAPSGAVGLGLGASGVAGDYPYYCTWSYTNGYPVSTLSASVAVGATSIKPQSVIGIYPGTTLTIYDLPNDEQIQVASTYVPGAATVPLVNGTIYSHASGVMVTNLPPAVKQAAIFLTTGLVKQRGSGAMIVSDLGMTSQIAPNTPQAGGGDIAAAFRLLNPYKQVFVGY